ncbi:hypothetical protein [Paenibacillus polymyxa]|uniref:hypothetical protein n=1 Tax=Paenibacillus polymyxa TaxID=1406 RepID=UPI0003D38329|nr:hypothetical protein [Paenibacillus polymyxa]AIW41805.1 hypothetical protein X809_38675 [Paenibacillus polymyxa CR1]
MYSVDSMEYRIIYCALCALAMEWEKDETGAEEIAQIHGVPVSAVHHALEALYTDNPDPDALEQDI